MQQEIKIPKIFSDSLAKSPASQSTVAATQELFKSWLQDSKLQFFPDYTDHGIDHINAVLETSSEIIHKDCQNLLTPEDAEILVHAILLHDSAMHLSKAGFQHLVRPEAQPPRIKYWDSQTWPELWSKYLLEAKNWNKELIYSVFGETEGAFFSTASGIDPFKRWETLTEIDLKLIGEFIRRNHSRLAHEFAVFGIPGQNSTRISTGQKREDLRDLAGLVARSHGMPLRPCLDYLKAQYSPSVAQVLSAHVPYLMVLIRISDFLQIQNRSSQLIFKYKWIPSKKSQLEHLTNSCVKSIDTNQDDPEAIYVSANPQDVRVFLNLRSWLSGLQQELDTSWAFLGEVYGRFTEKGSLGALQNFRLSTRRVRSNIELPGFKETILYEPIDARLSIAQVETLALLVRPLYSNRHEYGIRELVQNAVDAILERRFLDLKERRSPKRNSKISYSVTINIQSDRNGKFLCIKDEGIGMDLDTIVNYFLKAGATLRNSIYWRQNFDSDDTRGPTQKPLLRTGRFGVGALAAFLLGDEIEVKTKHRDSLQGYRFKATLSQEPIEITKDTSLKTGTVIRIPLSPSVAKFFSDDTWRHERDYDWYCGQEPLVERILNGRPLKQGHTICHGSSLHRSWRRINHTDFDDIIWTYDSSFPNLCCNYIKIQDLDDTWSHRNEVSWDNSLDIELRFPSLSILDSKGILPLNLQRTKFSQNDLPFKADLFLSVLKDLFSYMLAVSDSYHLTPELALKTSPYWGFTAHDDPTPVPWLATCTGWTLGLRHFISKLGGEGAILPERFFNADKIFKDRRIKQFMKSYDTCKIDWENNHLQGFTETLESLPIDQAIIFMESFPNKHNLPWGDGKSGVLKYISLNKVDSIPVDQASISSMVSEDDGEHDLFTLYSVRKGKDIQECIISKLWNSIFRHPLIPFDSKARRQQLKSAYKALSVNYKIWMKVLGNTKSMKK